MKHSVETEPFRPRQRPFRSALPAASNNFQSRQRHALTVMELLVVLSIIGILCVLVLPAVQQAREAARQVQCKNNLHQIGVALHSYQAAAGTLPPGWIIETPVRPESLSGWGWLAMALPQMEQGPLFNSINFSHHVGNDSNLTARLTVVEAFLCPTDHAPARVGFYLQAGAAIPSIHSASLSANTVMFEVAGASYAGVFGPEDPPDAAPDMLGPGTFFANSRTRAADITDGLSQTLIVGERSARHLATTWTGMHQFEEEGPERVIGFTERSPNSPDADEAGFSSRHPGGAHFLLGDGSVRFLSDHVDQTVYQALGTRAGQEPVGRTEF